MIGIDVPPLQLFNSYLYNRYQFTKASGVNSDRKLIKYGVSQGSILGPIFF